MPMNWCLAPQAADDFKRRILSGDIDPLKLADMTSAERHKFFVDRYGETIAKNLNLTLEEKLLLKNQQAGMINWAKRMMGKRQGVRDVVDKVQSMTKILTPADEDSFLAELAAHRLGTTISFDEATKIADLSGKVTTAKAAMASGGDRMDYGRAVVALRNYVSELSLNAEKLTREDFRKDFLGSSGKVLGRGAGMTKSMTASLDNSAIFRQGWKVLWTHPGAWRRNARRTFSDIVQTFGGKNVMDEINADIYSRPTYDQMKTAHLAVGIQEEAFPESLPEKIPGLGRIYKASENAYNGFLRRTRADVFDKYLEIADRSGVDINDKEELLAIGKLVNSLTGRAHMGKLEPVADVVNNVFFSPRFLKAQIDTLLLHPLGRGMTDFTQRQAAINLVKVVMASAAILLIARALKPEAVELDPRSSDFGKIRIGNTRFDMTGGQAGLVTLVARQINGSMKSSTTGRVTPLGGSTRPGAPTRASVVDNFFENKLAPAAGVVREWQKGRNFEGEEPTAGSVLQKLAMPMIIKNYQELQEQPDAPVLVALIADGLGISTSTYEAKKKK
jgi:hypothetical protein